MESPATFGLLVAFSAGLLSFLSPCVLPLVPSYVTFITGLSLEEVRTSRRTALIHALLFVLGFSLIFIALGATASVLGRVLFVARVWIARVGGALIILFGLYLLGAFNFRLLAQDRRVYLADKPIGYLGTVLVGLAFGAGWTPCIGPILGSILIYTSSTADLHRGLLLLTAYSAGLAVPFLIAALAIDRFLAAFARWRGAMKWVNRVGGVLLIIVGLLLITNYFTVLAGWLQALT
ncbi:MAG TPA: cytochrome c biogenesis protein CcdA, partial [Gemmatimonadaceae bacterium]|nr:cytochrome c biogenesis protein CcdA [Gemmatimonadaceae bacterium]